MVDPVADLLIGRGHPVRRVREVGLDKDDDAVVADYAIVEGLVIVTFDLDFRSSARRKGARCLHIRPPERSARDRLANHYRVIVGLFWEGADLVTLPADGPPVAPEIEAADQSTSGKLARASASRGVVE